MHDRRTAYPGGKQVQDHIQQRRKTLTSELQMLDITLHPDTTTGIMATVCRVTVELFPAIKHPQLMRKRQRRARQHPRHPIQPSRRLDDILFPAFLHWTFLRARWRISLTRRGIHQVRVPSIVFRREVQSTRIPLREEEKRFDCPQMSRLCFGVFLLAQNHPEYEMLAMLPEFVMEHESSRGA